MTVRTPSPAKSVALIREAMALAQGDTLPVKAAYDLLAKLNGYKDWATAAPYLKKEKTPKPAEPKIGYLREEIAGWPVYAVCLKNDDTEEELHILPQGVTLSSRVARYGEVDESGAKLMPNMFGISLSSPEVAAKALQSYVVTETFSIVSNPEKYGIPHYANDLGVGDWAVEDLGWNFVAYEAARGKLKPSVEVNFYDSGDDGAGKVWVQIAVEPQMALLLEAALAKQDVLFAEEVEEN